MTLFRTREHQAVDMCLRFQRAQPPLGPSKPGKQNAFPFGILVITTTPLEYVSRR